ncbi:helix-turn-helix domain-containing protein [Streptomyces sp. NBC_00335]|uniref:helix-turn-helix domain-containing protein n=1 Tax=unclassified Streptomyces TaxID=2593676 RepID=UPI002252D207|nr:MULTISPECIES: helix-turn-helix domain-containing protein [unclassified Streptomyces]MCX5403304.1 helix-turn-helix domain-containing protein [Streptomyces sp. NBC_00086]
MVHSAEAQAPSFPELLRFKRVQAGLTQRTLADLSTISPRTIRALESGRVNARMQTVRLLADALGLEGLARELFVTAGLGSGGPAPVGADPCLSVPKSVNALLGRDVEVRALVGALESDHRRLISLSGLAGVGKSRVAAETAARLSSRRGWPVLWIGAGAVAPGGHGAVFGPLLRSLRLLVESGAQDVSAVCRLIGRHEVLLVLDGVADARDPFGVEELLAYCPGIRVVSTSRAAWNIAGVQGTVLAPLAVPGPDWEAAGSLEVLAGVPSVRLLVDRLSEVRPGFVLGRADAGAAVRLCRTLDGLPAALEAAAARCGVLSLRRLADMPASELLELPAAARPAGVPGTIGCPIRSGVERLDPAARALLWELADLDKPLTVCEASDALDRPLNRVVEDLSALTGGGFVRAAHEETETRLHLPNLVRAVLA